MQRKFIIAMQQLGHDPIRSGVRTMMMYRWLRVLKLPMYSTMLGWCRLRSSSISPMIAASVSGGMPPSALRRERDDSRSQIGRVQRSPLGRAI